MMSCITGPDYAPSKVDIRYKNSRKGFVSCDFYFGGDYYQLEVAIIIVRNIIANRLHRQLKISEYTDSVRSHSVIKADFLQ
ncbi:unnamed protein product [Allacma fusca]|uniref:Uncharacterized protein n=1 Tax=Allacma fusca TaxID=39272 RepID=A0A8J2L8Y8_9HEXA|nr:unnamed protein product [Allacma fusca]